MTERNDREPWSDFFAGDLKAVKAKAFSGEVADSPFRSVCWKARRCPHVCLSRLD